MCATLSLLPCAARQAVLYPLIQRFSSILPAAGQGQWESSTKGKVGQVASQAGLLCPHRTGSPCIACALNSPVICIHSNNQISACL
ncbi:hypothetical protein NQZ68_025902 [Dissostichus eleginoides]|nr:hypothetical protein NQZ68_025902 [Dissostichus eleginoides]